VDLEEITSDDPTQTGVHGYSGVRMKYYIADRPIPGFKVHPAFINANGDEVDCYYIGAYEACLFDVSENRYLKYDSWDVTYDEQTDIYTVVKTNQYLASTSDKLSSIAGVKPASGQSSTAFTRTNVSTMARNRGTGWDSLNTKIVAAEQLLFAIEYASFNAQLSIGKGINIYSTSGTLNQSAFTGSTYSLGNGSGSATSTQRLQGNGTFNNYTADDYISVKYRGVENFWGNVWSYVDGANVWGDGTMGGGEVYICKDFEYTDNKKEANYMPVGFTLADTDDSYLRYFGYNEVYDWTFIPTKNGGNSNFPIGDTTRVTEKNNGYRMMLIGGYWGSSNRIGYYYYGFASLSNVKQRGIGARLIKV